MTEIVKFDPLKAEVAKYKAMNETLEFDYESKEGNAGARSHVFKLRKLKPQIIEVHREVKAEALAACQAIDGQKRSLIKDVEIMINVHSEPLRIIKQREEEEKLVIWKAKEAERLAEEARVQKELEDREAEIARKEAEIKAREDAIRAEQTRVMEEAERVERERYVAQEAAERARREAEGKAEAEKRSIEDAAAKKIADAEAEALAKIAAQERAAAIKAAKEEIEAKEAQFKKQQAETAERRRIENKKHRAEVKAEISKALFDIIQNEAQTTKLLNALDAGSIPNVTINY